MGVQGSHERDYNGDPAIWVVFIQCHDQHIGLVWLNIVLVLTRRFVDLRYIRL